MDFLFPSDELMLEDIFDFELRFSVDKFRKGGGSAGIPYSGVTTCGVSNEA